jgi:hypothetical protein
VEGLRAKLSRQIPLIATVGRTRGATALREQRPCSWIFEIIQRVVDAKPLRYSAITLALTHGEIVGVGLDVGEGPDGRTRGTRCTQLGAQGTPGPACGAQRHADRVQHDDRLRSDTSHRRARISSTRLDVHGSAQSAGCVRGLMQNSLPCEFRLAERRSFGAIPPF